MSTQKTYSSEKEIKEIWRLFRETEQIVKETAQQMKETDRRMKESDRKFDKTKKWMEAWFKESRERIRSADRRMKYLDDLFTGQWGRLMESLVEGDLVRLLKKRNIQVDHTLTNIEGRDYEFDIIAVNGNEVVVVEVKTTLKVKDVDDFQTKLNRFTGLCSEYKGKKIYGAAAYLKADQSSNKYAEKQGLFVIRAAGKSAGITNPADFKPKVFCLS